MTVLFSQMHVLTVNVHIFSNYNAEHRKTKRLFGELSTVADEVILYSKRPTTDASICCDSILVKT
jgi:hypothetical protein